MKIELVLRIDGTDSVAIDHHIDPKDGFDTNDIIGMAYQLQEIVIKTVNEMEGTHGQNIQL